MGLGSALQPCKDGQGRLAREVLCCPDPAVSLSTPVPRRSQAGGQLDADPWMQGGWGKRHWNPP